MSDHNWLPPGFDARSIVVRPDQLRAVAAILYERRKDIAGTRWWGRRRRLSSLLDSIVYLNMLADDREFNQSKESTMTTDPDQPTLDDVCTSIAESPTIEQAIRLTLGAVTSHRGAEARLADELLDRVYEEHDLSNARERDAAIARDQRQADRQDAYLLLEKRRRALELAVDHHRDLMSRPHDADPSIADLAREFADVLDGVRTHVTEPAPVPRGIDGLIRDTTEGPSTGVHVFGILSGEPYTVFREGNQIRQTDGSGFADHVSDAKLHEYLANDARNLSAPERAFMLAVLAIRGFERTVADR